MLERIATLGRARVIVQTLMRHGLFSVVDQLGLGDKNLVGNPPRSDRRAARFGRRLSLALNELGPTFVKLGQLLSTREDMLPPALISELAELQDNVQPVPGAEARAAVEAEFGADIDQLFDRFDDEPLAAGSIGQVHGARTRDGDEVVVKIRRPGIARVVDADLALLRTLAELAARRSPTVARHDPVAFVDEFGDNLRRELDFALEADATERMRAGLGKTARIPRVYRELSTASVLTLERIDAHRITRLEGERLRRRAARQLVACFATQLFRTGEFHADPHAGNVVYGERLVLFDMGATGSLDPSMRAAIARVSDAAGAKDGHGVAVALLDMVHVPATFERKAYLAEMSDFLDRLLARPLSEADLSAVVREALSISRLHGLRMRRKYMLLLRAFVLVDGVLTSLDPDLDPLRETRRYILRSWFTRAWFTTATKLVITTIRARLGRAMVWRRRPKQLPPAPIGVEDPP